MFRNKTKCYAYLKKFYLFNRNLYFDIQGYSSNLAILNSLNLSLLPVLFMFNFLYYTDAVSTTMVLLTYSLHLAGSVIHLMLNDPPLKLIVYPVQF